MELTATWYLVLSALLFSIGAAGLLVRRNPLVMFMCVELMLNAVNLTFVGLAWGLDDVQGQVAVFFVLVVAAAEVVVGLAIVVAIIAAVTCTFGNLAAYGQTNIKRLLAYSTIAHAGYMMLPVSAALASFAEIVTVAASFSAIVTVAVVTSTPTSPLLVPVKVTMTVSSPSSKASSTTPETLIVAVCAPIAPLVVKPI